MSIEVNGTDTITVEELAQALFRSYLIRGDTALSVAESEAYDLVMDIKVHRRSQEGYTKQWYTYSGKPYFDYHPVEFVTAEQIEAELESNPGIVRSDN